MSIQPDPSKRFILAEDSPLLANMAAIWAVDPALAAQLEDHLDSPGYETEPTKSAVPTLAIATPEGRRIHLHSRYQPLDEAKRLIDSASTDQKIVFCVHGFALGYHVENLFDRASPEALIVVLEPDLRMLRTAFEHRDYSKMLSSGRVLFLTRAERTDLMVRLNAQQVLITAGFQFVIHAPSLQLHSQFHREMQTLMGEFVAFCRTTVNTLLYNGQRTSQNIARNLPWYVSTPNISRLLGRHRKQPAIIVSAGPSLRKNKHLLKDAAGKAVIIAVQTTLMPLIEMGIQPDYATTLDYHEVSTRFHERLPKDIKTELIAEPKASSAVLKLYPGPMTVLGNDFAEKLLREMHLGKGTLRAGATVAHLAFYLAEFLGCDPIIFIGQDLGFSDGLCYTPGTGYDDVWRPELGRFSTVEMKQWEHIVRERPILRKIPDQQGRPMYTEERLFAYLQQFERDFAISPATIIDATEGGALKRGAQVMPLAEAIARFCTQPLPQLAAADSSPIHRDHVIEECQQCLRRRREEARKIEDLARQTLPLLDEVKQCLEDQPRTNRLIARIDALRAKMRELDAAYELVVQLAQKTELVKFHHDRWIAASRVSGEEKQRRQLARDIVGVQGIIDAAQSFQQLMDETLEIVVKSAAA